MKESVTAHSSRDSAPKIIGAKRSTETEGLVCLRTDQAVRERSHRTEAKGATHGGALGSKNAGTSNRNVGEIPTRRKIKVSFAMVINEGLVGPKPMATAGGDGHRVNIP